MHVDVFMKRHNEPPRLVLDQEMTGPATSGEGSSLFFGHARAKARSASSRFCPAMTWKRSAAHSAKFAFVAALRRQSRHRQSSPSTGIGRRLVSSAHQHGPARLQMNSVPHREQARRREAGFSNRFVMVTTESCP
jgi:hypothetical protein